MRIYWERCNVYHPSLLPARRHEPHCLYRPTENWQTWTSHSVKDQTFQTIQRGNSEGSLGNHRWSQIERPSRGEPESKQRGNFLHNCFTQNVLSIIKVIFRTSISKTKSVDKLMESHYLGIKLLETFGIKINKKTSMHL